MVSHAWQIGSWQIGALLLCRHFGTLLGMTSLASSKSSQRRSVPNELVSKVWRITGLDLYYLTMGKISKLKPQVKGLS